MKPHCWNAPTRRAQLGGLSAASLAAGPGRLMAQAYQAAGIKL